MPKTDIPKCDESRIDAFLSGKLSEGERAKFSVWLSKGYGMNADALKEASDAFLAGKDEPRMSAAQLVRFRQGLKKTIDADIGETKKAPISTPAQRPLWRPGLAPGVFAGSVPASQSDEHKAPRPSHVCLLIKMPGKSRRLWRQRYDEKNTETLAFRSVAAAIEKLKEIPLDTKVSIRHGTLTNAESSDLIAAQKDRRTALRRSRVSEMTAASKDDIRPSDMPSVSPTITTKPKRRR